MDFTALSKIYGTPLYIYDFDVLRENFLAFKNAFAGRKALICYALKANSNLSLLKFLASLGAGADCVSIGEVRRALLAGIAPYKIIFSGVGKRDEEILEALQKGILFINLESSQEMHRVEKIAQSLQIKARVSVRVNPNIDAKTHPYISTGLHENKFGVEIEEAKAMYLYIKSSPHLEAVGIHFHIGSQLCELDPILQASQKIAKLYSSLLALGLEIKFFDVGGGLGISYEGQSTIPLYDYAQGILASLGGYEPTIICEAGRRIVGECGVFLVRVIGEKSNGQKRFVIVDGAMNDLMRPSLYQAIHQATFWGEKRGEESVCDIVGPICESGDYLAKNVLLPPCAQGDLITFANAGAYGFSMSSQYNSRPRVAEVAISAGEHKLIREREEFEELIEKELKCLL
ncbi:diaminopimelate decarboxylase [Helicobacter pametensis]|uniref:diaminopimelate decarboxylase n=1 Tax=Helicobacter pametensis TaxID=95149 RepID=UPI0004845C89|nr:diaminopimelate decarboxylase [Helicobacter pametensis]